MIKLVLENNIFDFNNKHYKQTDGTAIGSRLGKNYACTYMRTWDRQLLTTAEKTPTMYVRFVDDIFGTWDHGVEALLQFQKQANSIHPNIKIELKWDHQEIAFLDTLVKLDNGKLETCLYSKPTDKHTYLHIKSEHPSSVKKAIPYGLAIRLKRISSKDDDYQREKKRLTQQLRKRGYPGKLIKGQLAKVDTKRREDLLVYRETDKRKNDRVPFVITYSSSLPDVRGIVQHRMTILHRSERMKTIFPEPSILAFKRQRNLADMLVHNKTNRALRQEEEKGSTECGKNCSVCPLMMRTDKLQSSDKKKEFNIGCHIDCESENIIYAIFCTACDRTVYVGETNRRLKDRIIEHRSNIKTGKDLSVSNHFSLKGHNLRDVRVIGVEKSRKKSDIYRKEREKLWMKLLHTVKPDGLNDKA